MGFDSAAGIDLLSDAKNKKMKKNTKYSFLTVFILMGSYIIVKGDNKFLSTEFFY